MSKGGYVVGLQLVIANDAYDLWQSIHLTDSFTQAKQLKQEKSKKV